MAKTLMLDVDGVLVTGRPEDGTFWTHRLEADLGINVARLQAVFFKPYWPQIVLGHADLRDCLMTCWSDLQTSTPVDVFLAYWFSQDARIDQNVLSDVDMLRAKGTRVYLATNQDHLRASYLMTELRLGDHVDGIIYSAQVGAQKPDAAFYSECEARSGASVDQITFVDDTLSNVDAARRRGWQAHHWTGETKLTDLAH